MDITNRALMNVSGLDLLGVFERIVGFIIGAALKPLKAVRKWNRTRMESRALFNMSDHMLRDIGISRDAMGRRP